MERWNFQANPTISTRNTKTLSTDLAWKLRLTAAMLGCGSRKDLAAAFRAANPRTPFALERAHKWLQGRAAPRDAALYADWARMLGTARPPSWVASCSRAAFLAELCALSEAEPSELEARAAAFGGAEPPEPARHYLCGDYAAYSHAWSPARRGQVIRGALRLAPGRGAGRFAATYRERIAGGELTLAGEAELSAGRVLHAALRDPAGGGFVFVALQAPGRPGAALAGVMAGATFASADPEPSATRIALLRAPPGTELEGSNGYLAPGAVAADAAALGLPPGAGEAAARFLAGGFVQVAPAEVAALEAAASGAGARPSSPVRAGGAFGA